MRILNVVGARPNFIKVAPLHRMFLNFPDIDSKIVHTGQHYDAFMSDVFFRQLEMPAPDHFLGIGGGSATEQTARIMLAFEPVLNAEKPDLVLVVGDVNSTLACALTSVRHEIPVLHVEAGLRSGDRTMPEEINRIMTDHISEDLFVTEQSGIDNLLRENIPQDRMHFVGNVMIDSLVYYREKASDMSLIKDLGLFSGHFILVTMHRPSNVDSREGLEKMIEVIRRIALKTKVVFPLHPRTLEKLSGYGLLTYLTNIKNLILLEPQGYLEFLHLTIHSAMVITDSGGVQEETTFLGIPCITLRPNTERPATVEIGTNYLIENGDLNVICDVADRILNGARKGEVPHFWDGCTAGRIAKIILEKYS
ncbi:non-hydrolyzing UDP-N-acetylglucosamine 2-epimerase [Dyadobacter sp. CY323]|uniref:non-hydrolyzing UDP-N-acetylglucosamine 2-epimerase n=1 Tax=Dyadobacter sp. CY323 TaxID=2907302 RepID=UPI001F1B4677|nr:UDP-N-acetylglucosamine 2-epimerase (non-hydrolyzing) [Dyadobacter sp. CY323]MCE6992728.1 UDP-N-acetylglucosamine 2-epimerase (non-hydrolyzing) [Dyadobacter sp. CY323]